MWTINEPIRGPKIKDKKSVFIATAYPVNSQLEIDSRIAEIADEFAKASHNAYAYQILESEAIRSACHDDGEVKGTAGEMILSHLERKQLCNIIVFVSRWYGGINLGKGGLIRMYSRTAQDLLDNITYVNL